MEGRKWEGRRSQGASLSLPAFDLRVFRGCLSSDIISCHGLSYLAVLAAGF